MSFKTIKRESTLEVIVQQIKDQIKKGILKPGEKLPSERKLADLLGVSRASIREAIQALAFSGYLEVNHGKGTFITDSAVKYDEICNFFSRLSDYSLDYLMEVRIMLEGEFARLATLRATKDEIDEIVRRYNEISNSKDLNTFVVKDLGLHLTIAKATHNPVMNSIMKIIGEMLYRETQKIIDLSKDTKEYTIKTTYNLVKAIREGNPDEAKNFMIEHIRSIKLSLKD